MTVGSSTASGSATPTNPVDAESQPLLKPARPKTPLPKLQLFLICVVRLAEPVAGTQIFPYVNDMCVRMGYASSEETVGFVSGLIDSLFAFVQLFTVMYWGRLSDRIGRKPVVLLGLCGVAFATLVFGLSQHLWLTVLARAMGGALSGNGAVIQTMISEMTDETNEAQAFALFSLMWAVGCIVGPSIGGLLSRPAGNFPSVFGGVQFWEKYPYFLPCLCSAGITGVSILTALFFLKETHPDKARHTQLPKAVQASYSTIPPEPDTEYPIPPPPTRWEILCSPAIPTVFLTAFMMMLVDESWDIVFILFAYTQVRLGGMSMSNAQLGYCLAGAGLTGACIHLFLFPRFAQRFGVPMYPWLIGLHIPMFASAALLNALLRLAGSGQTRGDINPWLTYTGAALLLGANGFATMVFPLNMMIVRRAAPSKLAMGATYGMCQMVTSLARAVAPWFASSLFAWTVQTGALSGQMVWGVMVVLTGLAVGQALRVGGALREAGEKRELAGGDE
ncbi:MFS general substrate transporter [Dacryopinax primogenitus]|uniref:MFS general substrate transporter n=1 Tax=Dacryopinax primogenitus (strain DJM 731) TaxID=1858805 RepID=M5FWF4_DACPD|nr:MFS general substrate transporter [Dacryopinax primogenitus]EJT97726.1 MFS general substrate transporter [Dacryopinax primogenitus]